MKTAREHWGDIEQAYSDSDELALIEARDAEHEAGKVALSAQLAEVQRERDEAVGLLRGFVRPGDEDHAAAYASAWLCSYDAKHGGGGNG